MDTLVYLGVLVGIAGIVFLSTYLMNKFKVTKEQLRFAEILLSLINHITSQFEFKYRQGITMIMSYVLEAISIVEEFDDIDDNDFVRKKELIFERAKEICLDNNIEINNGLEQILNEAIDYVINNYLS